MAKKQKTDDELLEGIAEPEEEGEYEGRSLTDLNFDVREEYKPDPLIAKGTYHGVATEIKFEPSKYCITWTFCLHDNGGVMSDGESPIDGAHVYFRNWLPKSGDENLTTKSGKGNKRQSKINMLQDFQNNLGIDMATPNTIATALAEQSWIGVEADLDVDIDEWQGRFRNQVNRANASKMF